MDQFSCVKAQYDFPEVPNYDTLDTQTEQQREARHGALLPSNLRAIFCGPTSSGKTNLALHLILTENGIRFSNLIVISPTLDQSKYRILDRVLKEVPNIQYHKLTSKKEFDQLLSKTGKELPPNTLIVLDDAQNDQYGDLVKKYFSIGRHCLVDTILITQSYTSIPKHLTREQANLIFLFPTSASNMELVYRENCFQEMPFTKFARLCNDAWGYAKHNALIIDKTRSIDNGKFRRALNEFYVGL